MKSLPACAASRIRASSTRMKKAAGPGRIFDTGTMAAAACTAVDLNADHCIDLACIGSATTSLKWYEAIK
jgi:hypothetical protein